MKSIKKAWRQASYFWLKGFLLIGSLVFLIPALIYDLLNEAYDEACFYADEAEMREESEGKGGAGDDVN